MRSLAIPAYTTPKNYTINSITMPTLSSPTDVLIRVSAASINPVDTKVAAGSFSFMHTATFPYAIGHDCSGTIVAVGDEVTEFVTGDEVFTMLPVTRGGAASEYAVSDASRLVKKPPSLSHIQAAAIPMATLTSTQALDRGNALLEGGLEGKTIFIPAGLSGTGSAAILLARNVFKVGKIITTVSTNKLPLVAQYLGEGTVDQVIDYQEKDVVKEVGQGVVDLYYDTAATCMAHLGIMKKGGAVVSITSMCRGETMDKLMPAPWLIKKFLDLAYGFNSWRVGRWGCKWDVLLTVLDTADLERITRWTEEGKYMPVVGKTVKLSNGDEVRMGCDAVYQGKGGVGKFVIEID
ncbi:chaperonin 10-like protein [Pyronema domesticum]|nr:chaperonin 10-like protein [Pyronema domesticum]